MVDDSSVPGRIVRTLPAHSYVDPSSYRLDLTNIFYKQWIYALHSSQLSDAGSYETLTIGDRPIVLVRGIDGVIRGFFNVCVHRGHWVVRGNGCVRQLTCPYHAWSYGLDGILRHARGVDVATLPKGHQGLMPIDVEELHGFLFVRLTPGGPSLRETFGNAFANVSAELPLDIRCKGCFA